MVCLRVPHDTIEGRRVQQVWDVASTTNAILELADHLVCQGVERVVVESTSYWRPFVYLLEARGLAAGWSTPATSRTCPGRPEDRQARRGLAGQAQRAGHAAASFVPPDIRQLRDYTRPAPDLTEERSRHKQRLEKLLEDALIKLSTVATDILGSRAGP